MRNQGFSLFFLSAFFLSTFTASFLAMDKANPYFTSDMVYENIQQLREQFFDKTVSKPNKTHDQRLVSWITTKVVNHRIAPIPGTGAFLVAENSSMVQPLWYLTLYAYNEEQLKIDFPTLEMCKTLLKLEPSSNINARAHPLSATLAATMCMLSESSYICINISSKYIVANMSKDYIDGTLGLENHEPALIYWKIDNRIPKIVAKDIDNSETLKSKPLLRVKIPYW